MTEIITFLIGFILGYGIASLLWLRKRQFIVSTNEKGQTRIEQVGRPKQKMEFLPDIDQKELEDIERPSPFQNFLGKFKKPAKTEEEEEEA